MFFFNNIHRFRSKLLRYNTTVKLDKNISFGDKLTNLYFKNKLKKSKFYFEYGSGASTILADRLDKKFISLELDKSYYKYVLRILKKKNIIYFNIGPVGEYSYPLFKNKKLIKNYVETIDKYFRRNVYPDFILIDGRFRVACCLNFLKFFNKKNFNPIILLDDFKKRSYYYVLKKYFYLKMVGRMALLLRPKKKFDKGIFNYYLNDPR